MTSGLHLLLLSCISSHYIPMHSPPLPNTRRICRQHHRQHQYYHPPSSSPRRTRTRRHRDRRRHRLHRRHRPRRHRLHRPRRTRLHRRTHRALSRRRRLGRRRNSNSDHTGRSEPDRRRGAVPVVRPRVVIRERVCRARPARRLSARIVEAVRVGAAAEAVVCA